MLENPQHGLFYVGQYMFIQKKGRVGHIVQHDIIHQQGQFVGHEKLVGPDFAH
jgi:hypothetical protein